MNSYLLPDKYKLHLSKEDMFDRIINLKLTVKKTDGSTEDFIIRSDYEAVFYNQSIMKVLSNNAFGDRAYTIRKCRYKPSVKFQYKRLANGTATLIDIFVSNFVIFSADGRTMATFNQADYNLIRVEVMMGYWSQFRDMPHASMSDLFTFEPMFGADKIVMENVEYVTTDKLPPDYTLHIHGYVGNIMSAPEDSGEEPDTYAKAVADTETLFVTDESDAPVSVDILPAEGQSDMEKIFESQITSRFYRYSTNVTADGFVATVSTRDHVKVYCSDYVRKIKLRGVRDSNGTLVQRKLYIKKGESLGNALTKVIQKVAPKHALTYSIRNDGNVEVFSLKETEDIVKLAEQKKKSKVKNSLSLKNLLTKALTETGFSDTGNVFETVYDNKLPAIYNIDVNATAIIVCPFFAFVDLFQEIQFEYRYHTSNLVSYYASIKTDRTVFYALNAEISFATVDDVNEMQIYCITEEGESDGE